MEMNTPLCEDGIQLASFEVPIRVCNVGTEDDMIEELGWIHVVLIRPHHNLAINGS